MGHLVFGAIIGWLYTVPVQEHRPPSHSALPWETYARGLAGHVVFGVATDSALRVTESV